MRRSIILLIASFAILFAVNISAGELAPSIVGATKLHEQLLDAREACVNSEQKADIEGIATGSPEMFRGVGPQSQDWPKVRAAYMRYAVSTCVPADISSYVELAASVYEEALTKQELKEILSFYETDAGKRFADVSWRLTTKLNTMMYEESAAIREKGGTKFESDMDEITRKP